MASNIQSLLNDILNAVYGRDVRDSIHDAIELCYDDVSEGKTIAEAAAESVDNSVEAATNAANLATAATTRANNAADSANNAAVEARSASSGLTEAISSANSAAASARTATTSATNAADSANSAAEAATAAADAANDAIEQIEEIDVDLDALLQAIDDANNAAQNANTAASGANSVIEAANNAADNANAKATVANSAASRVESALTSVSIATSNANTARDNANTAANNANTARDNANTAASQATSAATNATAAATNANTAINNINAKISAVDSKIFDANSAINNANSAADRATTAATNATSAYTMLNGLTVDSEDVGPAVPSSVVMQTVDGHKNLHFLLRQGASGASFIIKGDAFETLSDLTEGVSNPEVGDQYNVGSAAPYHVYRWTGTTWEDQGTIGSASDPITAQDVAAIQNGREIEGASTKVMKVEALRYLIHNVIVTLLADKVDKVTGKGLSTNDFTTDYLNALNNATSAIATLSSNKVDKVTGKGLSTNDLTNELLTTISSIGTGTLDTTAQTLIGAINELLSSKASLSSPALTDVPTAPTASSGTSTTQIATTAFVQGAISGVNTSITNLSSNIAAKPNLETIANPQEDGDAAVGTATTAARSDHVHPSDTSRAPLLSPAFDGTPTAPTAEAGTSTTQIATTAFVQGAISGVNTSISTLSTNIAAKPNLEGTTAPKVNGTAAVGSATTASKSDHVHPTDTTRQAKNRYFKAGSEECTVAASAWVQQSSPTVSGFPYRADIPITGVTTNTYAIVTFRGPDAISGNYAPLCGTHSGGVYIYSKTNVAITLNSIAILE